MKLGRHSGTQAQRANPESRCVAEYVSGFRVRPYGPSRNDSAVIMRFPAPLIPATLVKRYKRFLADVAMSDGTTITAHVANPGAMTGLATPGARVWLSKSDNPNRKLSHSWELVEVEVGAALATGLIPELAGYGSIRREVKYGKNSRVDFLLEGTGRPPCYIEIKNVHLMRQPGLAEFPDAKTERGRKHLDELGDMVAQGNRAVMLYLIQIGSASRFKLARDIDPKYGAAYDRARSRGVEAMAWKCAITHDGIEVAVPVPIVE
jgi:sugar fermentation stimulation protein A